MHIYIYTHTYTYTYIHIYIYTHTYTYTYTYIYMINSKIKCNYPIVAIFVINFTLMIIFCTRNMVGFLKMGATKTDRKGTGLELAFNNFHFPAILIIRKALKVDSPLLRWLTATRGSTTSMASSASWLLGCLGIRSCHGIAMLKGKMR
jgi:hypothetical protein